MSVMGLPGLANTSRSTRLGPVGINGASGRSAVEDPAVEAPRITSSPILVSWRPSMIRSSAFTSLTIHRHSYIGNDVNAP